MQRQLLLSAVLLASAVRAQEAPPVDQDLPAQMETMKRQLAAQQRLLDVLMREHAARQSTPDSAPSRAPGAGSTADTASASAAAPPVSLTNAHAPLPALPQPVAGDALDAQRGTGNPDAVPDRPTGAQAGPEPVGQAPSHARRPREVAPLFEQPGVLTPRGQLVLEPSLQFSYSSSNRVALVGYTVIPALLIGLIDVREVKRNTATAALSLRAGLSKRVELEARLPYVYRSDAAVSREMFTGTATDQVFNTSGKAIGDAELGLRYQLNGGGPDSAYYVAGLRLKSRTGRDPFSVVTDCVQRCVGPNATGTGLPLTLPTGSGFYSAQASLTALVPSDPAVFFGSLSYLHNVKRSDVSRLVRGGEHEFLGEIQPGDIVGINFGMGMGLNDKASFSLGYDHNVVGRTRLAGALAPGSVRTQLGTFLLGFSYRLSNTRSLNVAVGAGVTRDTPDVSLTLRMPVSW